MSSTSRPTDFEAVHRSCVAAFGECLLTINQLDASRRPLRLSRLASSDPQSYPVGGYKDKADTPWTQQVLIRGEAFVGEGPAAIKRAFDDAQLILDLGWRCVINQPLRLGSGLGSEVVGTFNVLAARPAWPASALEQVSHWSAQWLQTAATSFRCPGNSQILQVPPDASRDR